MISCKLFSKTCWWSSLDSDVKDIIFLKHHNIFHLSYSSCYMKPILPYWVLGFLFLLFWTQAYDYKVMLCDFQGRFEVIQHPFIFLGCLLGTLLPCSEEAKDMKKSCLGFWLMGPVKAIANNQHQLPMMWIGNLQDRQFFFLSFFLSFSLSFFFYCGKHFFM
jgi:hypothetical protein